jgi:uncharacterized protein (UPF0332 family)
LAQELLQDAKALLDMGSSRSSISRSYYAAYHACIALLEFRGLKPSNFTGKGGWPARRWEHGIIIALTAANPVFQAVLTPRLGLQVSWLYILRIRSDYRPGKPPSAKQAEEAHKAAERIVQKVEAKLK